jgi:hypothetical protein
MTRQATSLRGQAHCHVTLPLVLPERVIKTQWAMGAQQCGVAELDFDFRVSLYLERTQHDTDCCRSQETNGILG